MRVVVLKLACATAIALLLFACERSADSVNQQSDDQRMIVGEKFVDAFYSFDPDLLRLALSSAEESIPSILFYQGWAEAGNYEVVHRLPCHLENEETVACSITVKDDLMEALGIDFNVTDTFHLTFSGGRIVSATNSSNDLQVFYDAQEWVEENRPELIAEPCKMSTVMVSVFGRSPDDLTMLSLVAGTAGFCTNAGVVGLYALFAHCYPTHVRATGTGVSIGIGRGGAMLSPILAGFLFESGIGIPSVAMIMALGSLTAVAALIFLRVRPDEADTAIGLDRIVPREV